MTPQAGPGEGLYNSYEAAENGDYLSAVLYAGQDVLRGLQIVSFGVSARSLTAGFGDDAGRVAGDAAKNIKGACFAPGTLVLTDQGLRPIETLRIGDRVLSRDERTGETDWKEVRETFEIPNAAVVRVTIARPDGSATELVVTPDHRFWTTTRGWRTAEELAPGDRVATAGSQPLLVERVEAVRDRVTVHNLHVDQWETYFAGQESAWVHNMACGGGRGRMTPDQQALKEIVEEATLGGRKPLSRDQAETVLDWADEVDYPGRRAGQGTSRHRPTGTQTQSRTSTLTVPDAEHTYPSGRA